MLMDLPLAAVIDVFRGAVMVLFVISAFLLTIVILLQEGKGGGLAGAFGGAGAETFGVKAGTVNKFTAWLAALFLGLALLYAGLAAAPTDIGSAPSTDEFKKEKGEEGGAKDPDNADGNNAGGGNAGGDKAGGDNAGGDKNGK